MHILIKNSYNSLQYLSRSNSNVWMKLLKLLKILKSVDVGSSFQTLTIRTEKRYFLMSVLHNHTTKQHEMVSILLNIVNDPACTEKFIRDNVLLSFYHRTREGRVRGSADLHKIWSCGQNLHSALTLFLRCVLASTCIICI